MTRTRNRRRQCDGKFKYRTRAAATRTIRGFRAKGQWDSGASGRLDDQPTEPYTCPHCGRWHIGHIPHELQRRQRQPYRRERTDWQAEACA